MARSVWPALWGLFAAVSAGLVLPAAAAGSVYVIDGFVLGEQAEPGRDYRCAPAKLSSNFTWCERTRQERTRRGGFSSTISILSDQNGDAVYVNRTIEPAFFGPNEMASEIARLSARFGERAREIRVPSRDDVPTNVIAVWGKLQLQPLDGAALAALDPDDVSAQDMLLDPLGDLKRSRELKLPVYRLGGGAGYLWAAAHVNGRGHLRFLMADPSAFVAAPAVAVARSRPTSSAAAKANPATLAAAHPAPALAGTAAVVPAAEHAGSVPVNMSVRAKSRPDHAVPLLPQTEIDRVVLESERLAPEYTGSIATASARGDAEPLPAPPPLHRPESIVALGGLAAVLVFFLASLVARLVREPTGLELLELERRRELAAERAEQHGDALRCVRPDGRLAALRRVAARLPGVAGFGGGLKSVAVRLPASARRA